MTRKGGKAPRYTAEEDAILREMWAVPAPLKTMLDRLPRRSFGSVTTRAWLLGLGERPTKIRGCRHMPIHALAMQQIRRGPIRHAQIVKLTGYTLSAVSGWTKRMHEAGEIHIGSWHRNVAQGSRATPVWVLGPGANAPRPVRSKARPLTVRVPKVDIFAGLTARPLGVDAPFGAMVAA